MHGLFYYNNKFPFGRSEFLLIYSCIDQITLQPQKVGIMVEERKGKERGERIKRTGKS